MRHVNSPPISLIPLISLILLSSSLFAQKEPPYTFQKADIWLATGSFFTAFGSQYWLNNRPGFTEAQLASLTYPDINRIDQGTVGRYDATISRRSYYSLGVTGLMAVSTAAIPLKENRKAGWEQVGMLFLLGAENNFITLTGTNIAKGTIRRTRPFVFSQEAPLEKKMEPDARYSFFSGHTSLAAANSFFAAKVFSDYYPESKLKPLVWGAAVAVPALVASQRVRSGKHYPTDTAVGFLFGAACGYFVPHLHRASRSRVSGEVPPSPIAERHFRAPTSRIFPVWGQGVRGIALQLEF